MDESFEKLQVLLEVEDPDQIFACSVEETQANLQARGIDFSIEELKTFAKELESQCSEGELDESALDDVTGGAAGGAVLKAFAKWIAKVNGPKLINNISKWIR